MMSLIIRRDVERVAARSSEIQVDIFFFDLIDEGHLLNIELVQGFLYSK